MRKTLFQALEDDNAVSIGDETDNGGIEPINDDPEISEDSDDKQNGPLNVDLVYKKQQLETENKEDTHEYKTINKLLDKRDDGENPIGLALKANDDVEKEVSSDNQDLIDDIQTSDPDDDNDEKYVKLEYEDMALENYLDRFCNFDPVSNMYYSNEANSGRTYTYDNELGENILDGVGYMAGKGVQAAKSIANGSATVASKAYDLGKRGVSTATPVIGAAALYIGAKAINISKKSIISLQKYYERHRNNFSAIEKNLNKLRKDIILMDGIEKQGVYHKPKVTRFLLSSDSKNLTSLISQQMAFYKEYFNITISSMGMQKQIYSELMNSMNNENISKIIMKEITLPDTLLKLLKAYHKDEGNDLLENYESKIKFPGNKILLAVLPRKSIDTIDEYIDALSHSKVIIFQENKTNTNELHYLDKNGLLKLIDLSLHFCAILGDSKSQLNKFLGIKNTTLSILSKINILSKTEKASKLDKDQRHQLDSYCTASSEYIDRCYLDAYINLNNLYFNFLKYVVNFVKDHK